MYATTLHHIQSLGVHVWLTDGDGLWKCLLCFAHCHHNYHTTTTATATTTTITTIIIIIIIITSSTIITQSLIFVSFAKKIPIIYLFSSCLSVCLNVTTGASMNRFSLNFVFAVFNNCFDKFYLKFEKNNGNIST